MKFIDDQNANFQGERLRLVYIPLEQAEFWEENPKEHTLSDIVRSINLNGFGAPPKWDINLNDGKGGLVFGNGRTHALRWMKHNRELPPRGVLVNQETGQWAIPVLFGIDAKSQTAAKKFALDHNNLTLAGGDLSSIDMSRIYKKEAYMKILSELNEIGDMPITVDDYDFSGLKQYAAQLDQEQQAVNVKDLVNTDAESNSGQSDASQGDASSDANNTQSQDVSRGWPQIKAKVRPNLYDLYLSITEDFGDDDDERLEGLLKQYQKASKSYAD